MNFLLKPLPPIYMFPCGSLFFLKKGFNIELCVEIEI